MAIEIVMPRLGWTMEEGTLVEWLKQDGEAIHAGEIMFTIESDKALQEVESFEDGIFRIPPNSDVLGKAVPVGTLLAYIVQAGEALPFEQAGQSTPTAAVQPPPQSSPVNEGGSKQEALPTALSANGHQNGKSALPNISPRARRVAHELGVEWSAIKGSGRTGRIVERDIRAAALVPSAAPASTQISPVAKRAAEDLGVDVNALAAQMPGQRITREHVERAARPPAPSASAPHAEVRSAIPRLRKVIAKRMSASAQTTAPVTLTTEVDATELVKLRQGLKATSQSDPRPVPSYNDLLAKLVAEALALHPQLNARIEGDEIVTSSAINMGFAVDTERGLFVPVVRDVRAKSIRQIAAEGIALVQRVRDSSLLPDDLSGGTFTITNLGMYEIDAFTPIINLPQCAILGVGRIVPKQVVVDIEAERVAIRHMLFLSLTFDHRLVDGAPAARFLQQIKRFIEQPYLWLIN
ncbi:MAG: 2-oxo acid dehydrogenase subunit E2 [Anaerolineae bacterium]|nr:2-oxo acid dehydrogenase subunit E2 [Anaerolineae bacterium]